MSRCGAEASREDDEEPRCRGGEAYIYSLEMERKWNDEGNGEDLRSQCATGGGRREAEKAQQPNELRCEWD
jgi:hypothetical protein